LKRKNITDKAGGEAGRAADPTAERRLDAVWAKQGLVVPLNC